MDVVILCVSMCRPGLTGMELVMRWDRPQIWGRGSDWEGWDVTGLPLLGENGSWHLQTVPKQCKWARRQPWHWSLQPAHSQRAEAAVGQCLSLFPGLAAFTGADIARATLAHTKQKLVWEKGDLCHEGGETLPMFPAGFLTDKGIAGNP